MVDQSLAASRCIAEHVGDWRPQLALQLGSGLGDVIGPNGNYSDLPGFSKLVLSFGMLLGRLELFAVLVLFFPSFWKN